MEVKKIDEQKILFMNKSEISVHDSDALHAQKLNNWNGWWCSAGVRSLYIQHDGLIYRATCEQGGAMGSIYNEHFNSHVTEEWIQCTKTTCACGSDMQSLKVVDKADTYLATKVGMTDIDYSHLKLVDKVESPTISFCGAFKEYKLIVWEIGRRCNYDCWYCFPDSHNTYEGHKTLGSLMNGLESLELFWAKGYKMKFVFTGGEPTFNPDFLEFVTHLHDNLFHIAHTTTNGSHTEDYYKKLIQVSDIGFSAHLTYLENPKIYDKFIKNVRAAEASRLSNESSLANWLGVRIMLQPGKLELATRLYNDCKAITPNVTIDLIHGADKKIISYEEKEIIWMTKENGNISRN